MTRPAPVQTPSTPVLDRETLRDCFACLRKSASFLTAHRQVLKWSERSYANVVTFFFFAAAIVVLLKVDEASQSLSESAAIREANSRLTAIREIEAGHVVTGIEPTHDLPKILSKPGSPSPPICHHVLSQFGTPTREFLQAASVATALEPTKPYYQFVNISGRPHLQIARRDLRQTSCLHCHENFPSWDSEKKNANLWTLRVPVEDAMRKEAKSLRFLGFSAVSVLIVGGALVNRWHQKHLSTQQSCERISNTTTQVEHVTSELERAHRRLHAHARQLDRSRRASLNLLSDMRGEIDIKKTLMKQLRLLAYRDALTELPNRASILELIQHVIDRQDGRHFALLFLDFDRFKLINDSLGHDVGDKLLKQIARRLQETLRNTDDVVPARLGGDEFVVLLDHLEYPAEAVTVARRLLEAFSHPYHLDKHTVYSTASIGVVTSEHPYRSANEMLRDSDLAMYQAKSAHKGCYMVFDQSMRDGVQSRLDLESKLRDALSRNQFFLEYQPIVSLRTFQMEGVEALLRWKHPELGLVSPDTFIPVAEETGLIVSIGHWVLAEACRQMKQWRMTIGAKTPKCIHVNVSRKQLLVPNLPSLVATIASEHDVPAECLHLEVTESIIMENAQTAVRTMQELRSLGVKIDMDDFGTGHSSLSCLLECPIDVLKIDRAFVVNLGRGRNHAALVRAVAMLSTELGLPVVVEGIEHLEQATWLHSIGCEFGQGFYFARPQPPEEITRLATTRANSFVQSPPVHWANEPTRTARRASPPPAS